MFYVKAFTIRGNQVNFADYEFCSWEEAVVWIRKLLYAGYKVEVTNNKEKEEPNGS